MKSISILYIANDASLYGANKSLVNLLQSFNQKNIEIKVNYHVIIPNEGPIQKVFEDQNISYTIVHFRIDSAFLNNTFYSFISYIPKFIYKFWLEQSAVKVLIEIIRKRNVQIIHSNSSVIGIGFKIAQKCKLKHVWHLREFQDLGLKLRPFLGWAHLIKQINKSDAVISISQSISHHYRVKNNSFIIPDAVAREETILPLCKKSKYFLFCGSLSPNKGVHLAIRSFQNFHQKYPNYELLIAGTAISEHKNYEANLHKMVNIYGLDEQIKFLGYRNDIYEMMSKAQALLMCSSNEGLGRVTAEAMLNGCLVIGYDDAGTSELIQHGETGLLFKEENDLSSIMTDLVEKKLNSELMINNAIGFAKKHFLVENYGPKILNIYSSI